MLDNNMGVSINNEGYINDEVKNRCLDNYKIYFKGNCLVYENSCAIVRRIDNNKSFLTVCYSTHMYDDHGIELYKSKYADSFTLNDDYKCVDLNAELLSNMHRPTFKFGTLPQKPILSKNPKMTSSFRTYDNLALVHKLLQESNEEVNRVIHEVHAICGEYPDRLYWDNDILYRILDGKFDLVNGKFGQNVFEIDRRLNEEFAKMTKNSKQKDKEMINNLRNAIRKYQ